MVIHIQRLTFCLIYDIFPQPKMSKFMPRKLLLIVLIPGIILVFFTVLYGPKTAYAKNCGGGTACACGDTVTATTSPGDIGNLTCTTSGGLIVGASGITIDGAGSTITGGGSTNGFFPYYSGIYSYSYNNI